MKKMNVSIVIPAYNEEASVAGTVRDINNVCGACEAIDQFEVVVVNDGSRDQTEARAKESGATVISHPGNGGYGRSLKDGILNARHDTIIITDSDGTYPVDQIPALLEKYAQGFDLVIGAREKGMLKDSFYKSVLRKILQFLVEFTTGTEIPDVNSGLRVFSKSKVITYFNHLCDTFSFTSSQTMAYQMTGQFICFIPITYQERVGQTKVKLFRDMLRTIQYIVFQILYFNPFKLFLLLIGFFILLAGGAFLFSFVSGLNIGYYLGLICIISCAILLALGLMSEQLRQLMMR